MMTLCARIGIVGVLLGLCSLSPALAQSDATKPAPLSATERAGQALNHLFEHLARAQSMGQAKAIAEQIERRWQNSGSDTVNLLSQRAALAIQKDDLALAIELLDRMIALKPNWAEGYFQRALVFLLLEDQSRAVADLGRVLAREPRHYKAMTTWAMVLQKQEQKKPAYALYQRILQVYPLNETVKELADHLRADVEGRAL